MSGHSKWHSIRHKKVAEDKKRGKIFTKHARLIELAARGGGDPDMNPSLRAAIDSAKAENVPNSNIDRAIKKGSGENSGAAALEEVFYEGYGPLGVALYIQAITDNKNRTVTSIRTILSKNGGNLGEAGCTSWIFKQKGFLLIDPAGADADEMELKAIELGAEDTDRDDDLIAIYCDPNDFYNLREGFHESGFKIERAEVTFIPSNTVKIDDASEAKKVLRLVSLLEDDDDVTNVYANFDINNS